MIFPRVVNPVAVSTATRPVTQTALTEVKRESSQDKGTKCALGSINSPDPIKIIIRKLAEKIKAGGIFTELIILCKPDISEIPMSMIAKTIGTFPRKIPRKGFPILTMLKFASRTPSEKIKITIRTTRDRPFHFFNFNISGMYFVKKITRNINLKVDFNPARFSGELPNPI
jgi:hypothetical protein